jgi:hypothetical protein
MRHSFRRRAFDIGLNLLFVAVISYFIVVGYVIPILTDGPPPVAEIQQEELPASPPDLPAAPEPAS